MDAIQRDYRGHLRKPLQPVYRNVDRRAAIDVGNIGNASNPVVALDSAGNAIAVWQQADGGTDGLWYNRYESGTWGTATLIETNNAGGAELPMPLT